MRGFRIKNRIAPLPPMCQRASLVRWRMYIFMMSMMSYIQQCVVERCYQKLRNCAMQTDSFQVIKADHDRYLQEVAINCFLQEDTVMQPLLRCIDSCMKFSTLYYCSFNGCCEIDALQIMKRFDEFSSTFEVNMSRILERVLFLLRDNKYSGLNTFVEMCTPMMRAA